MSGLSSGETMNDKGKVLFVGRDIFLGTMISGIVQKVGYSCVSTSPTKVFNTVSADLSVKALVVDMKESKDFLPEIVEAGGTGSRPKLIAVTFHKDNDSRRYAQKAGFEYVIHRSQLGTHLPQILTGKERV
ncbi:MAG: hypothetical protein ACP5OP_08785 [Leptospirillia bacterium]